MSGTMNHLPCLGTIGEAAVKLIKFNVVLTQANYTPSSLTKQSQQLCPLNCQHCLSGSQLKYCWAAQLPGIVTNPTGQMGPRDSIHGWWDYDSGVTLGHSQNFLNRLSGQEVLEVHLNFGYKLISHLCLAYECSISSTGLALGQSSLPDCLEHHWAKLLPVVFANPSGLMGLEGTFCNGGAVILLPSWANQTVGLPKLFI